MNRAVLIDLFRAPLWQLPFIILLLAVIACMMVPLWLLATILDIALRICGTNPKELDEAQRILTSSPSRESRPRRLRP